MIALDLPPKLWSPEAPAIIRPAPQHLLRPGYLPVGRAAKRAALRELVQAGKITREQARYAVAFFLPPPFMGGNDTLIGAINNLNLAGNLKLCLDAGDAASYNPAIQTDKWLDRSGGGYDFFRGSGTGADAADPTHNGAAGGLSSAEYWGHDGGDYSTYDTTNEAWMDNIHKDNVKATIAVWSYIASVAAVEALAGTGNAAGETGFAFRVTTLSQLRFRVLNAGVVVLNPNSTATLATGSWHFLAVSIDESVGAGGLIWAINGTTETASSTYTSPSALAASRTMQIAAEGNAVNPLSSGSRLAGVAMWEGVALTAVQLTALFNATRGRFGV